MNGNASEKPRSNRTLRILHLFTLCSFAFTQPILTALARQSVYLHDQRFSWPEIGSLMLFLTLVIPTIVVLIDVSLQRLSNRFHGWGQNLTFIGLIGLILLSFVRPMSSNWWFALDGISGLLILSVVAPVSWWLSNAYQRRPALQSWLTLMSIGIVVFPAMFLWQLYLLSAEEYLSKHRFPARNPVPVVVIVFDEFNGMTLMNERMEIDQQKFPHFARLSECSTWYRNATTVSPRTDLAVPAILSGRIPTAPLPPLASSYPNNLLQLIHSTHAFEMKIFEPVTRLCPQAVGNLPPPLRPRWEKAIELIQTLAAVYPRLVFTNDTPVWFPRIPKAWFGLKWSPNQSWRQDIELEKGIFHYPGTEGRELQQEHLLKCIRPSSSPPFCFFHTCLPHYPWTFLPAGEQYQSELAAPRFPAGGRGELGEDWDNDPPLVLRNEFRYRLQLGFADRFIGQVLDRLSETGLLNDCLLIVTADHGVAFRPGHSRRLPDAEVLPDILSIPLFIKYPGQSDAKIDDRNIQSVDLLPTIAEVLQMELPDPIDGIAISSDVRSLRKTLYLESMTTIVEPDFPQRSSTLQRQTALFGRGGLDQLPAGYSSHPEWYGRSLSEFTIDEKAIPIELFNQRIPDAENGSWLNAVIEPRLIEGILKAEVMPAIPVEVVLAVDGIIRDSCKTSWDTGSEHGFQFLITKSMIDGPVGTVELFAVDPASSGLQLMRLKVVTSEKESIQ